MTEREWQPSLHYKYLRKEGGRKAATSGIATPLNNAAYVRTYATPTNALFYIIRAIFYTVPTRFDVITSPSSGS
jgi:hypothetical protein